MNITIKEAIDALNKRISPYTNCAADAEANEVIRMAIKALKQGDVLDKIKAEIEQEITYKPMEMRDYRMGLTKAIKIISKHT